ncbi:kinesin-like protein KIF2A [Paramacrobiotus metropolitanus]|uniref:kinesin-like protein KIF2A n=1 Tax=Paramacrobiotus metropolitanus TaxID=2943436 RepID=UPI00244615C2|nr:kinesin-like protein KIF2A [Paramacrobiotus metropolitanus]XP_055337891.1 kinesin-like protein KIF2A [Paramacrobiotus metropolitanus]XP_055337899.1 kinesin-like protein KIF2A [Paramacrobiotus metropolitanus]XP_055337906.1 kinesin-like protein KIF2A [Paramacrobiotus metropolitanus]XP_055337914.1 kinesin-like protein KIF2A [Paramacrobiotus metropolitanus]
MSVNTREAVSDPGPRLRKRINIYIQRSDGRVHQASVSDIDYEKECVIVEWIENGETKGKSVEFPAVFELNANLLPSRKSHYVDRETTNGNEVSPDGDDEEDLDDEISDDDDVLMVNVPASNDVLYEESEEPVTAPVQREDRESSKGMMMHLPGAPSTGLRRPTSAKNPRVTNTAAAPRRQLNSVSENGGDARQTGAPVTEMKRSTRAGVGAASKSLAGGSTAQQSARDRKTEVSPRPSLPGNQARMSNCARQIKKLEQNRNERRLRLEEAKQEKQKQMNADPGNPNWQFLAMIRDFRATLDINPLVISDVAHDKLINVCVRKRPLSKKEEQRKEVDVITVPSKDTMIMHDCKQKVDLTKYLDNQSFRFDYAFDDDATNEMVYKFTAQPLIQTIFEGGMATCFAYGQTGSGKTHTMGGNFSGKNQDCSTGIYAFAARDIFKHLQKPKYKKDNFSVRASFFEIYSGKVFDLLNKKKKLRILEDNQNQVQVCDLQEREVKAVEDVLHLIQLGNGVRTSGQTAANQHSSRSHAVFQIILRQKTGVLHGKFSFIDLAGNERGVDTMSTDRQTRLEGAEINKSLLALKECIRALARKGAHLPFRGSQLTKVLRDSFIGQNSRTCMIAMISPGISCSEHTLNTLRYAYRVKELDSGNGKEDSGRPLTGSGSGEEPGLLDTMSSMASDVGSLHYEEPELEENNEQLQTINALREAEDDVLEGQKIVLDTLDEFTKKFKDFNNITSEVDYNVDEYADHMEQTLADYDEIFAPLMAEFRRKFKRLREELAKEEEFSKSLTHK